MVCSQLPAGREDDETANYLPFAVGSDLPISAVGRQALADLLSAPLPGDGPVGEARVLSDHEDHPSWIGAAGLDFPAQLS
jgi:hypothetical protein